MREIAFHYLFFKLIFSLKKKKNYYENFKTLFYKCNLKLPVFQSGKKPFRGKKNCLSQFLGGGGVGGQSIPIAIRNQQKINK